jgi:hypothetical protein
VQPVLDDEAAEPVQATVDVAVGVDVGLVGLADVGEHHSGLRVVVGRNQN